MALPITIGVVVRMAVSYADDKLNIKEASEILLASIELILLLFPRVLSFAGSSEENIRAKG